jgi:hypothetical protein
VRPLLEGTLGRDVNPPGSAVFARGLGSDEARLCPLSGRRLDLNRAHQAFAALC